MAEGYSLGKTGNPDEILQRYETERILEKGEFKITERIVYRDGSSQEVTRVEPAGLAIQAAPKIRKTGRDKSDLLNRLSREN